MSGERQTPLQWAEHERLGKTPRFGDIEQRIGVTTEPYGSWFRRQQRWQLAAFVCGVVVFGALGTVGAGGWIPGIPGSGALSAPSSSTRDVLLPLSLLIGIAGIAMFFVQWWRAGRRADVFSYVVIVLTLLTCGSLWWRYTPDDLGGFVFVLMGVVSAGALALFVAETFCSRPGGVDAYRFMRLAGELQRLPASRRDDLLRVRHRMLDVLVERRALHPRDAEKLRELPLGAFWAVEQRFRRVGR